MRCVDWLCFTRYIAYNFNKKTYLELRNLLSIRNVSKLGQSRISLSAGVPKKCSELLKHYLLQKLILDTKNTNECSKFNKDIVDYYLYCWIIFIALNFIRTPSAILRMRHGKTVCMKWLFCICDKLQCNISDILSVDRDNH